MVLFAARWFVRSLKAVIFNPFNHSTAAILSLFSNPWIFLPFNVWCVYMQSLTKPLVIPFIHITEICHSLSSAKLHLMCYMYKYTYDYSSRSKCWTYCGDFSMFCRRSISMSSSKQSFHHISSELYELVRVLTIHICVICIHNKITILSKGAWSYCNNLQINIHKTYSIMHHHKVESIM